MGSVLKKASFCDRLLQEVSLSLQKTATAGGKDAGLRSISLEVLSLLTFAAEEDDLVTDCIMEGLLKIAASECAHLILHVF